MMDWRSKHAVVVGMARSGVAAARLLRRLNRSVRLTDAGDSPVLRNLARDLEQEGIVVELGGHTRDFLKGCEGMVISPGVRLDSAPVRWARESGMDVISEMELAWRFCRAPVVATTGTNGKTTTTTLIGEVLKAAGRRVHVLGNIGLPFSQSVLEINEADVVSLEVSSFQLEAIVHFRPRVAVILNLTPDHLDRYANVSEYWQAKKRIFMNQRPGDWLVLNKADQTFQGLESEVSSQVVYFNTPQDPPDLNPNQRAVVAVAQTFGVGLDLCRRVFADFKGVEHRMEHVREVSGVEFINDSKATNIDSTIWALDNLKKPAVLIAGGRDKGSDFSSLRDRLKDKIHHVVLVGEASDRIAQAWAGAVPVEKTQTYEEAVAVAYRLARAGDCVLLSPMCKSFDLFTDYEHRGRTFKELVHRLPDGGR